MRRRRGDNTEARGPLFGWRTLAAVVSLGPIWFGIGSTDWLDSARGNLWVTVAMLWSLVVVGWVIVRPVAWWLGWKWPAWLRRWFGWVRLPPFGVCYGICAATMLMVIAWLLLDAQFVTTCAIAVQAVSVDRSDPFVDVVLSEYLRWGALGPRIAALYALLFVAGLSAAGVVIRMFVGARRTGRSLRGWMMVTLLIAGWLGICTSIDQLNWWGMQWRVRSALPRFQVAAEPLLKAWPRENGSLPEAGDYTTVLFWPDVIMLEPERFAPRETFGQYVIRTATNGLRFVLESDPECFVEHHPPGQAPTSFQDPSNQEFRLEDAVRLSEGWHLARYHQLPYAGPIVDP